MGLLAVAAGLFLISLALLEGFETIVLPRRVDRPLRFTRWFYRLTWWAFSGPVRRSSGGRRRDGYLSFYGPLSLILLLAVWAAMLVVGFGLVYWGTGSELVGAETPVGFGGTLYMSGTTFFTLGFGDITPRDPFSRLVSVVEVGTGFGFLALVIGYLPVLYQAFSRREVSISLLDARAGSPPTALELFCRYGHAGDTAPVVELLHDWERWSAELLESHLSYPLLCYYRSQHERESWVAALTMILDASALGSVGVDGVPERQARLTFAMARHAAVDLAQIFLRPAHESYPDRLPPADLARLRAVLQANGVPLREGPDADAELTALRRLYEPYVSALAAHLLMPLPPWLPVSRAQDDWQTTAEEAVGPPEAEQSAVVAEDTPVRQVARPRE